MKCKEKKKSYGFKKRYNWIILRIIGIGVEEPKHNNESNIEWRTSCFQLLIFNELIWVGIAKFSWK